MASEHKKSEFNCDNLSSAMAQQGLDHKLKQAHCSHSVLAEGELTFAMFPSGIGIHCVNAIEKQKATSSVNLSPCLSINILLEGALTFSLGDSLYQFSAVQKPVLFFNIISQPEIFTRHMLDNQKVVKANITLEKSWLLARCQSSNDIAKIAALFTHKTAVNSINCGKIISELAANLIEYKTNKNVTSELQAEQCCYQIINQCLPQIIDNTSAGSEQAQQITTSHHLYTSCQKAENDTFADTLDSLINTNMSLSNIAKSMGVSISTLQRKVKSLHQMTMIEYMRSKRLEKAKNAIVLGGISIGEASFMAGYQHVENFVTAFKKRFNITPAEFRKTHCL